MSDIILIVAAHPDDEVLGCGGTIARLALEGNKIYISILGEGITSRCDSREKADQSLIRTLRGCSQDAAALLGAKDLFSHNLPDNRFDTLPLLEIAKMLEQIIEKVSPEVIYTHHAGDLNMDHSLVSRATLIAARPIAGSSIRTVYTYEVPSSTDWAFQCFEPIFRPNVFVDISETLDLKIEALGCYETEVRSFPHPRSPEAIRAIAARWGSTVGCMAAEAFELIYSRR